VLVHQPGEAIARDALQVILQIEVVVGDASEEFAPMRTVALWDRRHGFGEVVEALWLAQRAGAQIENARERAGAIDRAAEDQLKVVVPLLDRRGMPPVGTREPHGGGDGFGAGHLGGVFGVVDLGGGLATNGAGVIEILQGCVVPPQPVVPAVPELPGRGEAQILAVAQRKTQRQILVAVFGHCGRPVRFGRRRLVEVIGRRRGPALPGRSPWILRIASMRSSRCSSLL